MESQRIEGSYSLDGHTLWHSSFDLDRLLAPKVILDIGAYDFGDSIRFKRQFPECRVVGIEMSTPIYDKFHAFAEAQGIETIHAAITSANGTTPYWQATNASGIHAQSSLLRPDFPYLEKYGFIVRHVPAGDMVEAVRMDTLCRRIGIEHIDFAHVDVEGAEYLVIAGLGDMRPDLMFLEFLIDRGWQGMPGFEFVEDQMAALGYEMEMALSHDRLFARMA